MECCLGCGCSRSTEPPAPNGLCFPGMCGRAERNVAGVDKRHTCAELAGYSSERLTPWAADVVPTSGCRVFLTLKLASNFHLPRSQACVLACVTALAWLSAGEAVSFSVDSCTKAPMVWLLEHYMRVSWLSWGAADGLAGRVLLVSAWAACRHDAPSPCLPDMDR